MSINPSFSLDRHGGALLRHLFKRLVILVPFEVVLVGGVFADNFPIFVVLAQKDLLEVSLQLLTLLACKVSVVVSHVDKRVLYVGLHPEL